MEPVYRSRADGTRQHPAAGCAGKDAFETRALAEDVARRIRRRGSRVGVYTCPTCRKLHVGSR